MQLKQIIPILILTTLFMSCGSEIPATDPVFDKTLAINERIELAINEGFIKQMGYSEAFEKSISDFYKQRNYSAVWSNDSMVTPSYVRFKHFFNQPNVIGLPSTRLMKKENKKLEKALVYKELLMTAHLAQTYHDLHIGFMDTSINKMRPVLAAKPEILEQLISQKDTVKRWDKWFAFFGPNVGNYQQLAKVLFNTTYNKAISDKTFKIPEFKKDTLECLKQSKAALKEKGYLKTIDVDDQTFEDSLMSFQVKHGLKPDAKLGEFTIMMLSESEQHKINRAVLSLERWRWRAPFPERYIYVNIPEYTLRLYYNDSLLSQHNVVVGKRENRTPQLTSRIRNIIAMPYWTQPQSIASKEFLPAIQANSNYAAKNHYKVYRGNMEVDPKTINWKKYKEKNFPFRVKQEPGSDNALGLVKFEFANEFGVYLHDTPSKSFFRRDVRSFSHGCIRCEMPDSLARFILRRDEKNKMLPDSLDSLIARKVHMPIPLRKPVTIQIDYITVVATGVGEIRIHPDIYGRDEEYLKWMK